MSISLGGKIVEAGKTRDGNEIVIEVVPGQLVTVQGVSNTVAKEAAAHLYKSVTLTLDFEEAS